MWYIIPHTKTKIIAHVHTCTRHTGTRAHSQTFFGDVSIRNSLRSNKSVVDAIPKFLLYVIPIQISDMGLVYVLDVFCDR